MRLWLMGKGYTIDLHCVVWFIMLGKEEGLCTQDECSSNKNAKLASCMTKQDRKAKGWVHLKEALTSHLLRAMIENCRFD